MDATYTMKMAFLSVCSLSIMESKIKTRNTYGNPKYLEIKNTLLNNPLVKEEIIRQKTFSMEYENTTC